MSQPAFQREAIARILACLRSRRGSRRFLLADEVGLGKTHVARGVIDGLREGAKKPLVVFYISSSREIAHQNRRKLAPNEDEEQIDDRLTLFAQHVRPGRRLEPGSLRLLTLTPGTSLFLGRNTGVRKERLLLLYFVKRLRPKLFSVRCRDTFRCGVRQKTAWRSESTWRSLSSPKQFGRRMDARLMAELRREWKKPLRDLTSLLKGRGKPDRGERNRVIGSLRRGLATAVVKSLAPDLIVLDEFQRFRDVIQPPGPNRLEHILDDWFFPVVSAERLSATACPPILLLSATPYRFYTTMQEEAKGGRHLDQLFEVLRFVSNVGDDDVHLNRLREDLEKFSRRLTESDIGDDDTAILDLKHRVEDRLKRLMCRTERNWYYADERKGVTELQSGEGVEDLPTPAEAREWRDLSMLLVDAASESAGQAMDYWKSCPACLSFMSEDYQVRRTLKTLRSPAVRQQERRLLATTEDLPRRVNENLKFRKLVHAVFGQQASAAAATSTNASSSAEGWRFLWCAPTYRYWRGRLFETPDGSVVEPSKFLVFSHWRFVPGATALLVSQCAERALGCYRSKDWRQAEPLRFRQDGTFGVFDVCFPSTALASTVDPAAIALSLHRRRVEVTLELVQQEASRHLERALKSASVFVERLGQRRKSQTSRTPLWRVVARLDAKHEEEQRATTPALKADWLGHTLDEYRRHRRSSASRGERSYEEAYLRKYLDWIDAEAKPVTRTTITPHQFDRLLQIALHSPAISLLRAVRRAVPDVHERHWYGHVLAAGLSGVRHYFNRPYAKAIIERATGARRTGYADKVLAYCAEGELQAVFDEYAFLLAEQESGGSTDRARAARAIVDGMARVLKMGVGTPRVRVRASSKKRGRPWTSHQGRSHFALAFAEDSSEDGGGRGRRRHTREAFNSPFWPFVLATTSVGQEGLDFHWYCRDVVHWNLPSNPVDLEQREGRINRRDGLVVRRSVARDVPLRALRSTAARTEAVWSAVFSRVSEVASGSHHDRHGLFPRWMYESRRAPEAGRIRRHVFHYSGSRDLLKYERLKQDLAWYRLVFGQANQEDLLARLREHAERSGTGSERLDAYMLNLAPFKRGFAWHAARTEAYERLKRLDWRWLRALVGDAEKLLARHGSAMGTAAHAAGVKLCGVVRNATTGAVAPSTGSLPRDVVAALVYLRNPYDDQFDIHRSVGFRDDALRLIQVARAVRSRGTVSTQG